VKFSVVTLFPEMVAEVLNSGVVGSAFKVGLAHLELVNPRAFTSDVHKSVDDRPFGGGDGMVMLAEPLIECLKKLKVEERAERPPSTRVIYLSPQGKTLSQAKVLELRNQQHLVLICGRYGGIDQRFLNTYIDEEISVGDYVVSGGELPACVLIDGVCRQIPGVLGNLESAHADSFVNGLLEAPLFTRPRESASGQVPEVLLSGNHAKIRQWRQGVALLVTLQKRPDLCANLVEADQKLMQKAWTELSSAEKTALGLKPNLL
jgi:tRNA (guanine37-N1)-methyltransferase